MSQMQHTSVTTDTHGTKRRGKSATVSSTNSAVSFLRNAFCTAATSGSFRPSGGRVTARIRLLRSLAAFKSMA